MTANNLRLEELLAAEIAYLGKAHADSIRNMFGLSLNMIKDAIKEHTSTNPSYLGAFSENGRHIKNMGIAMLRPEEVGTIRRSLENEYGKDIAQRALERGIGAIRELVYKPLAESVLYSDGVIPAGISARGIALQYLIEYLSQPVGDPILESYAGTLIIKENANSPLKAAYN